MTIQILIYLTIIILFLASLKDIKTREVYDYLSYGLIFFSSGTTILFSIFNHTLNPIFEAIFGGIIGWIIGYTLYRTGQWGGGDAKLIIGIGITIGIPFKLIVSKFLIFLFYSIISGAILGILFSFYLVIKFWNKFKIEFIKENKKRIYLWVKIILILFSTLIIITSLNYDNQLKVLIYTSILISIISVYLIIIIKSVEEIGLIKKISPEELSEGDWVLNDIIINNKKIYDTNNLGISKDEIQLLIKLKEEGKLKYVKIKEGMPFVPALLIGFILTYLL